MKELIKRLLPTSVFNSLKRVKTDADLARAYRYDRGRFVRYSSTITPDSSRQNLASRITETYHNLEKGLSLPSPRPGFGSKPVGDLLNYLASYQSRFGVDDVTKAAKGVLHAYLRFNSASNVSPAEIPHFDRIVSCLQGNADINANAGVRSIDRTSVMSAVGGTELEFFTSRSSVRQFSSAEVAVEDIHFAALAAQKSPAVCNRQFSKLYILSDPKDIARALEIQGGARGFGDEIPRLAVVTTNVRNFWGPGERTQPWTDGGMFAMSFVLGLHARGLGSICLNWSKTRETDVRFRAALAIPEEEVIVMLVGFGHLRDSFAVASSPRCDLAETLVIR